jgi:glycosyltransferase involved in cell wall biosynthesis
MKVLIVSNLYPPAVRGGYELSCARAVAGLREHGHEVIVLTSKLGKGEGEDREVFRRLPLLKQTFTGSLRAPLASIAAARTTREVIRSFRPDLVFAWNCAQIPHVCVYVPLELGVPTAIAVSEHWFGRFLKGDQFARHLFPGDRGFRRLWAGLIRLVNRHPALRIDVRHAPVPVAVAWDTHFMERSTPRPAICSPVLERVILETSHQFDHLGKIERRPDERPLICFAGRLSHEKGADIAVRALAEVRASGFDARLALAGTGTARERRELGALAHELGVSAQCTFTGWLDGTELGDLLARASALVVPSVWEEPLGLTVLEGALARVPVVASRIGGILEQIREGEHALFFEPGSVKECADALVETFSKPTDAAERVERAYAHVAIRTPQSYGEQMTSFAEDALRILGPSSPRSA